MAERNVSTPYRLTPPDRRRRSDFRHVLISRDCDINIIFQMQAMPMVSLKIKSSGENQNKTAIGYQKINNFITKVKSDILYFLMGLISSCLIFHRRCWECYRLYHGITACQGFIVAEWLVIWNNQAPYRRRRPGQNIPSCQCWRVICSYLFIWKTLGSEGVKALSISWKIDMIITEAVKAGQLSGHWHGQGRFGVTDEKPGHLLMAASIHEAGVTINMKNHAW